jgi:hypothetical protein
MLGCAIGTAHLAAQGECQIVVDANRKIFDVPVHLYTTSNTGGKTITVESIYAAGNLYIKIEGKWTSGGSTKDMAEMMRKKQQDHGGTCRLVKDELVDGEMAAQYSVSSQIRKAGTFNSQIWISKSKGLPLREEDDIDIGSKTHNSTRYEYAGVKPPL